LTQTATEGTGPKTPKPYSLAKLIRGSGSRVIHLCLMTVIGLMLTPMIVRSLGAEQYGIWALAYGFIGYFSLLDFGMSASVFTHMCYALTEGDHDEAQRIYRTGMAIFGTSGLIVLAGTLILTLSVGQFYHSNGPVLAAVIALAGFSAAISFPIRTTFGVLHAGSHFDIASGLFILTAILRVIGTLIVLHFHHGVVALTAVSVVSCMPSHILSIVIVKLKYPFLRVFERPRFETETTGKLLKFAFPMLFGQIADRLRLQTDTLTVSFFIGFTAVAHYNIATTLAMYYMDGIVAIIGVLGSVLCIQKSANDTAGLRQSVFGGTRVGICAAGFVLFGIVAWGHAFIQRWMGVTFLDAYPILVVLAVAMFLDVSQSTSVNALFATLNQKAYAVLNVSEALANLGLSIALARPFGMMGVAVGTLIPCIIVRLFVQPFVVEHYVGISVKAYFSVTLPTAGRVVLFLLAPLMITRLLLHPTYASMLEVGIISAVFFALPVWYFEFQMRGARGALSFLQSFTTPAGVKKSQA
jgi:O-antigen/teichoic acid export membrane protein